MNITRYIVRDIRTGEFLSRTHRRTRNKSRLGVWTRHCDAVSALSTAAYREHGQSAWGVEPVEVIIPELQETDASSKAQADSPA